MIRGEGQSPNAACHVPAGISSLSVLGISMPVWRFIACSFLCGVFCPTSYRCEGLRLRPPLAGLRTRAVGAVGRRLLGEPNRLVEEDPLLVGSG